MTIADSMCVYAIAVSAEMYVDQTTIAASPFNDVSLCARRHGHTLCRHHVFAQRQLDGGLSQTHTGCFYVECVAG